MPRLPIVSTVLLRSADAASLTASLIDRYADLLRAVAGGEEGPGEPASERSRPVAVPVEPEPAPETAEHTVGRSAAERREPTPQPAQGASSASRSRRISNPKAARKVRARSARAETLDTVEVGPGSGHGGTPESVTAENTPKERARTRGGRQPAPMGSRE